MHIDDPELRGEAHEQAGALEGLRYTEVVYAKGLGTVAVHSAYDGWSPRSIVDIFDAASDAEYVDADGGPLDQRVKSLGMQVVTHSLCEVAWWVGMQMCQEELPLLDTTAMLDTPADVFEFVYVDHDGKDQFVICVYNFSNFPLTSSGQRRLYKLMLQIGAQDESGDALIRRVILLNAGKDDRTVSYYGDDWATLSVNLIDGEEDVVQYAGKLYPRERFF
jgi:hypothetical protein